MSTIGDHLKFLRTRADQLVAEGQPGHGNRQNDRRFQFFALLLCGVHLEELEALVAAAPQRDWPEDFEREDGQHETVCLDCRSLFKGHKTRPLCRECYFAFKATQPLRDPGCGNIDGGYECNCGQCFLGDQGGG